MDDTFSRISLLEWIYGTIDTMNKKGWDWEKAWIRTYFAAGGLIANMASKKGPMNAARILYETGRIKDTGIEYQTVDFADILKDSVCGVYALVALDVLQMNPNLNFRSMCTLLSDECRRKFKRAPSADQTPAKIAFILFKFGKIQCE